MKIAGIVQARMGSTRLEDKMLKDIEGKPLIHHVFERLKGSTKLNFVGLATTTQPADQALIDWAKENNIPSFRGSEEDVLNRYYQAALNWKADIIVRVTADDPFKDPEMIDQMLEEFQGEGLDFMTNNNPPSYPEGLDIEIMTFEALQKAETNAATQFEREHVTQYFYKNLSQFKWTNYHCETNLSRLRWTIDTAEDLEMARAVYKKLYSPERLFSYRQIVELFEQDPSLVAINQDIDRSFMYQDKRGKDGKNN